MSTRSRNMGVVAVLLLGAAGALGVLAGAAVLSQAPEDADVAISVNGVPVTFGEFRHQLALTAAGDEVQARALDPSDSLELPDQDPVARVGMRAVQQFNDRWSVEVRATATLINYAASYSEARRLGVEPTAEEIAAEAEDTLATEERMLEAFDPTVDLIAAMFRARRDAFADGEYEGTVVPERARWAAARNNVIEATGIPPQESMVTAAFAATSAHIEVHEALGVTSEEVRDYLDQLMLMQIEFRQLSERLEPDEAMSGVASP